MTESQQEFYADEWSNGSGEFTVSVGPGQVLLAPERDGRPQKYLPCLYCGRLMPVDLEVVGDFCSDACVVAGRDQG